MEITDAIFKKLDIVDFEHLKREIEKTDSFGSGGHVGGGDGPGLILPIEEDGIAFKLMEYTPNWIRNHDEGILPHTLQSQGMFMDFYKSLRGYISFSRKFAKTNGLRLVRFEYAGNHNYWPEGLEDISANEIQTIDQTELGISTKRFDLKNLEKFVQFHRKGGFNSIVSEYSKVTSLWQKYLDKCHDRRFPD